MDVKQAIETAKTYMKDIYSDEEVTNLGLEEIERQLSGNPSSEPGRCRAR